MPDPVITQDPMEKLHSVMVENKLFSGSIDDFKKKYSTQKSIDQLYENAKTAELFSKDKFAFYEKYFPEKREDAAHERLYRAVKDAGYEGTERDFREQYKSDEGLSQLYQLAHKRELYSGSETDFRKKYFPSKAFEQPGIQEVKKKSTGDFIQDLPNRFADFPSGGETSTGSTKPPVAQPKQPEVFLKPGEAPMGKKQQGLDQEALSSLKDWGEQQAAKRNENTTKANETAKQYFDKYKGDIIQSNAQGISKSSEFNSAMQSLGGLDNPAARALQNRIASEIGKAPANVLPEHIAQAEEQVNQNPLAAIAKHAKGDKDVQASVYLLSKNAQGNKQTEQINKNFEGIKNGELHLDVNSGKVLKPEGFWESLGTGVQEWGKGYHDAHQLATMPEEEAAKMLDEERGSEEPTPVPKGRLAEIGQMAGSMAAPIVATVFSGGTAAPIIFGADMATHAYPTRVKQKYYELRDKGVDPVTAMKQAKEAGQVAAAVEGVEGAVFGKVAEVGSGLKAASNVDQFLENATKRGLSYAGKTAASGAAVGGMFTGGALLEGKTPQQAIDEGISNAKMIVGLSLFGKALGQVGKGSVSKMALAELRGWIAEQPPELVKEKLDAAVQLGGITEEQAAKVNENIESHKEVDSKIPDNVENPEVRDRVAELIRKRDALREKEKKEDPAFAPKTKERIKEYEEKILEESGSKEAKKAPEKSDLNDELADLFARTGNVKKEKVKTESAEPPKSLEAELDELANKNVEPSKTEDHAIQEHSAGSVLQHPQEGVGEKGSERSGVEQSVEGNEATQARNSSQEVLEGKIKEVGKPDVKLDLIPKTELRKAEDFKKVSTEHTRIKEEYKKLRQLIDCLWA